MRLVERRQQGVCIPSWLLPILLCLGLDVQRNDRATQATAGSGKELRPAQHVAEVGNPKEITYRRG